MADHDDRGKFALGNKASVKHSGPGKSLKELTKIEVQRTIASVFRPHIDIEQEIQDKTVSGFQMLTNKALLGGNTKFIQWLIEMGIGKPVQQTIETKQYVPETIITKLDGTTIEHKLVEKEDTAG